MADLSLSATIRAKKLGALIRDARLSKGKSLDDCAGAIGVNRSEFEDLEFGDPPPSLPQVELLALYLQVPLEYFWGSRVLADSRKDGSLTDAAQLIQLRQRMIGAQLRQARTDLGLTLEQLSEMTALDRDTLESCELGEKMLDLPRLEAVVNSLNCTIRDFQDKKGPVGAWMAKEKAIQGLLEMPEDLVGFVSKPINRPYLELAQRLSEMSVEKLRAVAEGLLEITL